MLRDITNYELAYKNLRSNDASDVIQCRLVNYSKMLRDITKYNYELAYMNERNSSPLAIFDVT